MCIRKQNYYDIALAYMGQAHESGCGLCKFAYGYTSIISGFTIYRGLVFRCKKNTRLNVLLFHMAAGQSCNTPLTEKVVFNDKTKS